jgi:hypothetical protein
MKHFLGNRIFLSSGYKWMRIRFCGSVTKYFEKSGMDLVGCSSGSAGYNKRFEQINKIILVNPSHFFSKNRINGRFSEAGPVNLVASKFNPFPRDQSVAVPEKFETPGTVLHLIKNEPPNFAPTKLLP